MSYFILNNKDSFQQWKADSIIAMWFEGDLNIDINNKDVKMFMFDMKINDIVLVKSNGNSFVSIAQVIGEYYFDNQASSENHRRKVRYLGPPIATKQFPFDIGRTIMKIDSNSKFSINDIHDFLSNHIV